MKADADLAFEQRRDRRAKMSLVRGLQMLLLDRSFRIEVVAPVAHIVGAALPPMEQFGGDPPVHNIGSSALPLTEPPATTPVAPVGEGFGPRQPRKWKKHEMPGAPGSTGAVVTEEAAAIAEALAHARRPPMMPGGSPAATTAQLVAARWAPSGLASTSGKGLPRGHAGVRSSSTPSPSLQPEHVLAMLPANAWPGDLPGSGRFVNGMLTIGRKDSQRRLPSLSSMAQPPESPRSPTSRPVSRRARERAR